MPASLEQILDRGLSHEAAKSRLEKFGPNELPSKEKSGLLKRLAKLLKEPMLLLLVMISVIYLVMGDITEGIALAFSALFVIAIAYYQDFKSERALEALKELSSPRALVIRQREQKRIPASELVPGDLVLLQEGDRVPADGFLIHSTHLMIDESLITGEAFPVKKEVFQAADESAVEDLAEASRVYMGTLVVGGKGFIRILETGAKTEMGRIGGSLSGLGISETFLSQEIRRIVRFFVWIGGMLCFGIVALYGFSREDWLGGVLAGLATAMALLPEEFPVVLTVFLAIGAWRLSKVKVLVRNPSATERLGAITALCVDKTGTITLNKMTVSGLATESEFRDSFVKPEESFNDLIRCGFLASQPNPVDPMEKAILTLANRVSIGHGALELSKEFPLTKELFATSFAWKTKEGGFQVFTKGAPEAVISLCKLPNERAAKIFDQVQRLARQGQRVLGVARTKVSSLPNSQNELPLEWIGLLGFEDPVREEVPSAMALCRKAGIHVYMITGDFPETARKVAEKAGIEITGRVLSGPDIENMNEEELKLQLGQVRIFARMKPEQKLRIVHALKASGNVVGMTGDGVNDAPSLKQSDIGIAMGARGTDVAREASDIVLIDDNFASIVSGIERGRSIFANLKKSISYIISIHVPLAGLSFFPVLFDWPMLLMPLHIALLELIIDPTCSLLFEAQESDPQIMNRPPRKVSESLFLPRDFILYFLEGCLILVPSLLLYRYEISVHNDPDQARTVSFLFLGICNIGLILADLSGGRYSVLLKFLENRLNAALLLLVFLAFLIPVEFPPVARVLHFSSLSIDDLAKSIGFGFLFFIVAAFWNRYAGTRKSGI